MHQRGPEERVGGALRGQLSLLGEPAGGDEEVDANLETVRLLRSQLRQKGSLRVIEAEALPLAEVAAQQGEGASTPPSSPRRSASSSRSPAAPRSRLTPATQATVLTRGAAGDSVARNPFVT
jgi:hypothetical protein